MCISYCIDILNSSALWACAHCSLRFLLLANRSETRCGRYRWNPSASRFDVFLLRCFAALSLLNRLLGYRSLPVSSNLFIFYLPRPLSSTRHFSSTELRLRGWFFLLLAPFWVNTGLSWKSQQRSRSRNNIPKTPCHNQLESFLPILMFGLNINWSSGSVSEWITW